jgi:hypothetical protein
MQKFKTNVANQITLTMNGQGEQPAEHQSQHLPLKQQGNAALPKCCEAPCPLEVTISSTKTIAN